MNETDRWYLGYDLREPLPDHSSLTRIRERYGLRIFRCFFERIVEECFEAGLVWGKELYFDATKVEANASLGSMGTRLVVEDRLQEHLVGIFPEQEEARPKEGANAPEIVAVLGPTGREGEALAEANASWHRWIEEAGRQQREVVRWGYRRGYSALTPFPYSNAHLTGSYEPGMSTSLDRTDFGS